MIESYGSEEFFIDGPVTDLDNEMLVKLTDVIVAGSPISLQAQHGVHALDSSLMIYTEEVVGEGTTLSVDLIGNSQQLLEITFDQKGQFGAELEHPDGVITATESMEAAIDDLLHLADLPLSPDELTILNYIRDVAYNMIERPLEWNARPVLDGDRTADAVLIDIVKNRPDIILRERHRRLEDKDGTTFVLSSQNFLGLPAEDWLKTPRIQLSYEDDEGDTFEILTIARDGTVYYDPAEEVLSELHEVFGDTYEDIIAQPCNEDEDPFTRRRAAEYIQKLHYTVMSLTIRN